MSRLVVWLAVVGTLFSGSAHASSQFSAEMSLLSKKVKLCSIEMDEGKYNGGFCSDLMSYNSFLFKGSAATYIEYHSNNGDITGKNIKYVEDILQKLTSTISRITAGPH